MILDIVEWIAAHILLLVVAGFVGLLVLYDLYHKFADREVEDRRGLQQDLQDRDFADRRGEEHGKVLKEKDAFANYNSWS